MEIIVIQLSLFRKMHNFNDKTEVLWKVRSSCGGFDILLRLG